MLPATAVLLLDDLNRLRLEVMLVPSRRPEEAKRGAMIRAVVGQNPHWYSQLCSAHQKRRLRKTAKPDTRVVRRDLVRLLERVAAGKAVKSHLIDWLDRCLVLPA